MRGDSFVFDISFPVDEASWRVKCRVTLFLNTLASGGLDGGVDTIRIIDAVHSGIRLDESSWRELLKEYGLLRDFCSDMMGYSSLLKWSLSRPVVGE